MNTPTHVLIGAAAFARPGAGSVNAAAIAGSLAPDLSLYILVFWNLGVLGRSPDQVFGQDYYAPFWQSIFAVDNSAPLYAAMLAAGLLARAQRIGPPLAAFAGAALLHIAADFPLHHDDGRPHFWPLSNWIFQSPLSYWDPARYGATVSLVETGLFVALAVLLWRRFRARAARAVIGVAMALQLGARIGWAVALS